MVSIVSCSLDAAVAAAFGAPSPRPVLCSPPWPVVGVGAAVTAVQRPPTCPAVGAGAVVLKHHYYSVILFNCLQLIVFMLLINYAPRPSRRRRSPLLPQWELASPTVSAVGAGAVAHQLQLHLASAYCFRISFCFTSLSFCFSSYSRAAGLAGLAGPVAVWCLDSSRMISWSSTSNREDSWSSVRLLTP